VIARNLDEYKHLNAINRNNEHLHIEKQVLLA